MKKPTTRNPHDHAIQAEMRRLQKLLENENIEDIQDLDDIQFELFKDAYDEKPVTIDEFIHSEDFLGPYYGKDMRPFWMEYLRYLYPGCLTSTSSEIILLLPRGVGKTTLAIIVAMYELHKLLCLKAPQDFFGMQPMTQIWFLFFSKTQKHASEVGFSEFLGIVEEIPWFRRFITKSGASRLDLKKRIIISTASGEDAIGKAVYYSSLDEANFAGASNATAAAKIKKSYISAVTSQETRFSAGPGGTSGVIPGKMMLLSSPNPEMSILEDHVSQRDGEKGVSIVSGYPSWEIHDVGYSGERFLVHTGSDSMDPMIIEDPRALKNMPELEIESIIEVPIELMANARRDLEMFLRDYVGIFTLSSFKYLNPEEMRMMQNAWTSRPLTRAEVIPVGFNTPVDELFSYFYEDAVKELRDTTCLRYIHVDAATKHDRCGIASCYVKHVRTIVQVYNEETGNYEHKSTSSMQYYIDFAIALEAEEDEEIPLDRVVDLLARLRDLYNYPINGVSIDGFQGEMFAQQFQRKGFNVMRLSLDKQVDAHEQFRHALRRGQINLPNYAVDTIKWVGDEPLLHEEMKNLRIIDGKYDHPPYSSKDIADAVIGAFYDRFSDDHFIYRNSGEGVFERHEGFADKLKSIGKNARQNKMVESLFTPKF